MYSEKHILFLKEEFKKLSKSLDDMVALDHIMVSPHWNAIKTKIEDIRERGSSPAANGSLREIYLTVVTWADILRALPEHEQGIPKRTMELYNAIRKTLTDAQEILDRIEYRSGHRSKKRKRKSHGLRK